MKITIGEYPVIDNHCHPFPMGRENPLFERYWSISLLPQPVEDTRHTIVFQMVMRELAKQFDMPTDAPFDRIIARRNELYHTDPGKYVRELYRSANIEGLLVDFGYPITGPRLTREEGLEFSGYTEGTAIGPILRVEHVTLDLLELRLDFDEFCSQFRQRILGMIRENGLVALKSVIAYYTGLEIQKRSAEEVRRGYDDYFADPHDRAAEKVIHDHQFFVSAEICLEQNIPLQIHTGMGDTPICDLRKTNPLLLHEALTQEVCQKATLVLIHTGYPFVCETGFLVSHYPRLFLDVSSMVPYAGIAAESKLLEVMEMTPMTKILYGSDGGGIPEHCWFGAIYFRGVLERTLNRLIDGGFVGAAFAEEAARLILRDNVRRIYKKIRS